MVAYYGLWCWRDIGGAVAPATGECWIPEFKYKMNRNELFKHGAELQSFVLFLRSEQQTLETDKVHNRIRQWQSVKHPKIHLYFNEATKILPHTRKTNMLCECVCVHTCDVHLCLCVYIGKHSFVCPVTRLHNVWLSFAAKWNTFRTMPQSIMALNAYFAVHTIYNTLKRENICICDADETHIAHKRDVLHENCMRSASWRFIYVLCNAIFPP